MVYGVMPRPRPSTVVDVARKVGVSPSTVSRAYNQPGVVHPATLERVMNAARELNYVPNALARGLITGKSGFVALVVPDITDPFFARLAQSLDQALRSAGMILIVCHTGEQRSEEEHLTQLLQERQIDGLVWCSEAPADSAPSPLDGSRIPKVMIERLPENTLVDAILLDKRGAYEVAEYLYGLGHRRIAMVTGHPHTYGGRELYRAFHASLLRYGLDLAEPYIVSGNFTFEGARAAANYLMNLDPAPTAVFVGSDRMTHGFMIGLIQHGVRVPEDLSVVAFSTSLVDTLVHPLLTSCQSDYEQIGREAARLLLERIQHPELSSRTVWIPTQLLIRGSCLQIAGLASAATMAPAPEEVITT